MKSIIKNGILILPEEMEENGYVVFENGIITQIGKGSYVGQNPSDIVYDAKQNYVSPGFIDMHTHGAGGYDFMDNTVESYLGIARKHAEHGTTSLVPTTLTSTMDELIKTFDIYEQAKKENIKGAAFLGVHLEGPYFSYNQRGAQDPKYLRNPEPEEYNEILRRSNNIIRWSIAPELKGALELGDVLKSKGILASIGHSDASYDKVIEAHKHGYNHITHLYSCMSTITRKHAYRYAGVLEAAYMIDDMSVEIIADGIHVPQALLQYVCKFKPHNLIALCTDSMRAAGMPDGIYNIGSLANGQKVIKEDGIAKLLDRSAFAGSVATSDLLVRTMIKLAGLSVHDAVQMMSHNPSRILGVDNKKGSLTVGKDADIIIFDKNIDVQKTFVNGKMIYSKN